MSETSAGAAESQLAIPGYELLEQVGEGGRGTVYRARQLSLDRTVAVKVLRSEAPRGDEDAAFQRESRLMASLAHPNLVTVFDSGRARGSQYLVTEFVAGSTLRSRMTAGQPWPLKDAVVVLDSIARALTYIHEHGILHLDLKPENILRTAEGDIKIADFGLALAQVDARTLSELGLAQGTFDYCSPEQRFGLLTDDRSDLFSFAVVVHELLTGSLPGRVYESARLLNPKLPAAMDRVLSRGLARDPNERYASVEEFRRDLLAVLAGPGRRRRASWAALAFLVGIGVIVAARWFGDGGIGPMGPPPQSWLLVDEADPFAAQLEEGETAPGGPPLPTRVAVHGRAPQGLGEPDLPCWPEPRPVFVLTTRHELAFIHLLEKPSLGRRIIDRWEQLVRIRHLPPEDNFIQGGTFDGDCLTADNRSDSPYWRMANVGLLGEADSLAIATPEDQPGNPALSIVRKNPLTAGRELGCYEWLARIPDRPGTIMVLRYRARAEEGTSRLKVMPRMPLTIPPNAQDAAAKRLRAISSPLPNYESSAAGPPACSLADWVRPTSEWRTYYLIWEWPQFCTETNHRNIEIAHIGLGTVWLDDLELFTLAERVSP